MTEGADRCRSAGILTLRRGSSSREDKLDTAAALAAREMFLDMAKCEVCENEYDKAFEVVVAGEHHTFDSFECAIHALAPVCPHCNCRIVGHGVEQGDQIFCCVHCARSAGATQLKDRL